MATGEQIKMGKMLKVYINERSATGRIAYLNGSPMFRKTWFNVTDDEHGNRTYIATFDVLHDAAKLSVQLFRGTGMTGKLEQNQFDIQLFECGPMLRIEFTDSPFFVEFRGKVLGSINPRYVRIKRIEDEKKENYDGGRGGSNPGILY